MITVPVYEAKTRLSELLAQAQQGAEITITRHGQPVARLGPPQGPSRAATARSQRAAVAEVIATLDKLRQGVTLDVPLREAIESGRD